jgi:hypothetical protein
MLWYRRGILVLREKFRADLFLKDKSIGVIGRGLNKYEAKG